LPVSIVCAGLLTVGILIPVAKTQATQIAFDSMDGLQTHNVTAEPVTYQGRRALRVTEAGQAREDRLVILKGIDFQDGVIEIDLAGKPGAGAPELARGFIGVAFRVAPDVSRFECIYLRPTNARAEDQVRRNHSVQYVSFPDFPWQKLRKEMPEKYESYADLVPGEWTKVKIQVQGVKARLFVHGAEQPALVINDLKLGTARGAVALWIGPGTEGYFANLRIAP
jgi:hypothetical protein